MTLDELMNDPTPRFVRMVSHEPKDGYFWNDYFEHYEEGDALFRARIKAAYSAEEWRGPTHEGPTCASS
ncbi:hypothetical protein LMG22037_05615 [Paraburkholderia phenoliruptrix]|uniref:Uncharacterized protein n=1 Tax=Paraburkholderia phenoliruptrix TaxID=252970 RepID=A0A6J5CCK6_9BURK|nr:hypothetical protein [Paraburkholderia phenoliruptrix]CAB3731455.1 hypothetical protein LMG22037_05615 [Paraburkholderia phenoliruptrix]